jgi:hypothetical protein
MPSTGARILACLHTAVAQPDFIQEQQRVAPTWRVAGGPDARPVLPELRTPGSPRMMRRTRRTTTRGTRYTYAARKP